MAQARKRATAPLAVRMAPAAVTVLRAIETMKTGRRIELKPEEFRAWVALEGARECLSADSRELTQIGATATDGEGLDVFCGVRWP